MDHPGNGKNSRAFTVKTETGEVRLMTQHEVNDFVRQTIRRAKVSTTSSVSTASSNLPQEFLVKKTSKPSTVHIPARSTEMSKTTMKQSVENDGVDDDRDGASSSVVAIRGHQVDTTERREENNATVPLETPPSEVLTASSPSLRNKLFVSEGHLKRVIRSSMQRARLARNQTVSPLGGHTRRNSSKRRARRSAEDDKNTNDDSSDGAVEGSTSSIPLTIQTVSTNSIPSTAIVETEKPKSPVSARRAFLGNEEGGAASNRRFFLSGTGGKPELVRAQAKPTAIHGATRAEPEPPITKQPSTRREKRKVLTHDEIRSIVTTSMQRAQLNARKEIEQMESRKDGVVLQKEVAAVALDAMHRARESAQNEIRGLVKEAFRHAPSSQQAEIRSTVREAMQKARETAKEEMSALVKRIVKRQKQKNIAGRQAGAAVDTSDKDCGERETKEISSSGNTDLNVKSEGQGSETPPGSKESKNLSLSVTGDIKADNRPLSIDRLTKRGAIFTSPGGRGYQFFGAEEQTDDAKQQDDIPFDEADHSLGKRHRMRLRHQLHVQHQTQQLQDSMAVQLETPEIQSTMEQEDAGIEEHTEEKFPASLPPFVVRCTNDDNRDEADSSSVERDSNSELESYLPQADERNDSSNAEVPVVHAIPIVRSASPQKGECTGIELCLSKEEEQESYPDSPISSPAISSQRREESFIEELLAAEEAPTNSPAEPTVSAIDTDPSDADGQLRGSPKDQDAIETPEEDGVAGSGLSYSGKMIVKLEDEVNGHLVQQSPTKRLAAVPEQKSPATETEMSKNRGQTTPSSQQTNKLNMSSPRSLSRSEADPPVLGEASPPTSPTSTKSNTPENRARSPFARPTRHSMMESQVVSVKVTPETNSEVKSAMNEQRVVTSSYHPSSNSNANAQMHGRLWGVGRSPSKPKRKKKSGQYSVARPRPDTPEDGVLLSDDSLWTDAESPEKSIGENQRFFQEQVHERMERSPANRPTASAWRIRENVVTDEFLARIASRKGSKITADELQMLLDSTAVAAVDTVPSDVFDNVMSSGSKSSDILVAPMRHEDRFCLGFMSFWEENDGLDPKSDLEPRDSLPANTWGSLDDYDTEENVSYQDDVIRSTRPSFSFSQDGTDSLYTYDDEEEEDLDNGRSWNWW